MRLDGGVRVEGYVGWMACSGVNVITAVVKWRERNHSMLRERCLYGTQAKYVAILVAAK